MFTYKDLKHSHDVLNITQIETPTGRWDPFYVPKKKILIIGNGFDIRAEIQSTFADFILYVVYGCALFNYKSKTEIKISDDEIKQFFSDPDCPFQLKAHENSTGEILEECIEFASSKMGELILNQLFPCFYRHIYFQPPENVPYDIPEDIYEYDNEKDTIRYIYGLEGGCPFSDEPEYDWMYLPNDLRKKGIKSFCYLITNELYNNPCKLKLWLDIETIIEMIVTQSDDLKEKYEINYPIPKNKSSTDSYLQGLNLFEKLLANYLVFAEEHPKKDISASKYFGEISEDFADSLAKRSNFLIQGVDISDATTVINYNYTNIAEKFFKQKNPNIDIRYINGALHVEENLKLNEIDTNIVIGYSNLENS